MSALSRELLLAPQARARAAASREPEPAATLAQTRERLQAALSLAAERRFCSGVRRLLLLSRLVSARTALHTRETLPANSLHSSAWLLYLRRSFRPTYSLKAWHSLLMKHAAGQLVQMSGGQEYCPTSCSRVGQAHRVVQSQANSSVRPEDAWAVFSWHRCAIEHLSV